MEVETTVSMGISGSSNGRAAKHSTIFSTIEQGVKLYETIVSMGTSGSFNGGSDVLYHIRPYSVA